AQIAIIIAQATVPVVVDAGIGAPSHAAEAMELGADAVLVNTALAAARDPVRMGRAFKMAVEAAREAVDAGLPTQLDHAEATSPLTAFLSGQNPTYPPLRQQEPAALPRFHCGFWIADFGIDCKLVAHLPPLFTRHPLLIPCPTSRLP